MVDIECDFPVSGLLPKKETGVSSFLNKYPEYDGRGITIAIFDSGVDPGAAGLQITSEGKPKVIERYDCSGAGDVDTSTVVKAVDGEIQGLTQRKLKIPSNWTNPSGDFHIGIKNAYEIYPKKLVERIIKERREKLWDPEHKNAVAEVTRKLNTLNKNLEANKSQQTSRADKLYKEELEAQLDVLNHMEKKYTDLGPVYDCVVFHDGDIWRACIDTSEFGDLSSCKLLGEYSVTREFASLTPSDQLNYSINVHDDGNVLEIVGMCSGHGTHVASIAAACFPDAPEKNGIAPGAQIVSLSIGDNRLDSMETGTALARAMMRVMQGTENNQVHIINMSYGEHTHFSSSGRLGELMTEVVDKYGVVWVASAGNHGPALCTLSTPPDICTANIIGVGAYVSPEMMQAEYSLRQKLPGMPYTWSSRGPTMDGDKGITVCAPGAAITSVPCFTLRGTQLLNGTSMSAPHVTGAIALLLSGLSARKLQYSPFSVKRALENSALFVDSMDPFAQGYGLLQVEKAFEHLVNYSSTRERDVRFQVSCGLGNNKGIHIRSGIQDSPKEYTVTIEPVFADSDNVDPEKKISFQMSLALACNADWVHCPDYLELMNLGRMVSVKVDPTSLPAGVHNTCIRAYDVSCPDKGPVFRVEITVVRPLTIPKDFPKPHFSMKNVQFQPNTIKRHFILIPDEVTWAILRMQGLQADKFGRFVVHAIQLRPKLCCKTLEFHKMINISSLAEVSLGFQVKGGLVLELVIAKYWANLGDIEVNYSLELHGCRPDNNSITMHHADGIHSLELSSGIQMEEISPNIQIKNSVSILRPSDAKIVAMTSRDVFPPSRHVYQLQLTFNFHLNKQTEIMPNSSLLSDLLYESEFESQLWMLFDSNKQLLYAGDAFANKYSVKLEKGDYTIRQQVRHERRDLLEKLQELPMLLNQKLANPITVDVYGSQSQALIGGKKMTSAILPTGKYTLPLYIAPLPSDKLQKTGIGMQGQYLTGTIAFAKDEIGKKVDVYPFKYILMEPGKKNTSSSSSSKTNEKTKWEEYEEAVRDVKISWLSRLDPGEEADKLYEELCLTHQSHLPVYTAMMASLESEAHKEWPSSEKRIAPTVLHRIMSIANIVISAVDKTELLAYLGTKSDQRQDAAKIKVMMDRQKAALIDALNRYGSAMCRLYLLQDEKADEKSVSGESNTALPQETTPTTTSFTVTDIDNVWLDLIRFADPNDTKAVGHFAVWHARVHGHYCRMLKALNKLYEDKPTKELEEVIIWTMRSLGWNHSAKLLSSTLYARHPPAYRPF